MVCDEAQHLKSNGKTTDAVCALLRKHGIHITETPQQNGYRDWYAVLRFARIELLCDNERLQFYVELMFSDDETLFALHSIVMFCNTTSTIHKSEGKQDRDYVQGCITISEHITRCFSSQGVAGPSATTLTMLSSQMV